MEEILSKIEAHLFALAGLKFFELKIIMSSNPSMYTKDDKMQLRLLHEDYVDLITDAREPNGTEGSTVGEEQ